MVASNQQFIVASIRQLSPQNDTCCLESSIVSKRQFHLLRTKYFPWRFYAFVLWLRVLFNCLELKSIYHYEGYRRLKILTTRQRQKLFEVDIILEDNLNLPFVRNNFLKTNRFMHLQSSVNLPPFSEHDFF